MMTSNRPLEDWAQLIGDVPATTVILDRFLQHAQFISITGKCYRLRHGGKADAGADLDSAAKKECRVRPSADGEEYSAGPPAG